MTEICNFLLRSDEYYNDAAEATSVRECIRSFMHGWMSFFLYFSVCVVRFSYKFSFHAITPPSRLMEFKNLKKNYIGIFYDDSSEVEFASLSLGGLWRLVD